MEKQEIKISYFNLLQRSIYLWKEDTLNTSAKKHQCNKILEELMDTSKKSVGHLTEEQTEIVRRYIGVYEKEEDFCEISEKMHVPFVFVQNQFYDATKRMISRIKHGYIIVKDELLSGKLTQDGLLKLQLKWIILQKKDTMYGYYIILDIKQLKNLLNHHLEFIVNIQF